MTHKTINIKGNNMKQFSALLMVLSLATFIGSSVNAVAAEPDKAEQVIYRLGSQGIRKIFYR